MVKKMTNIIICDDDINFSIYLKAFLEKKLTAVNKITIAYSPYDVLEEINNYDILFLDYEMPHMDGLTILKKIKRLSIIKIMISNYDYISFNTYIYHLFWFVRKDNFDYDISQLIPELQEKIFQIEKKFIINDRKSFLSLYFYDINYIETNSNYLLIYTNKNIYKIRSTFTSIISQFDNSYFIMPIHGILVNVNYIKHIDLHNSSIILNNDILINISRSKKEAIKKLYGNTHNYSL